MKYTIMLSIIFFFSLTSCMHTMMLGKHESHSDHAAVKITKEVTNNGMTLSVSVDPMIVESASSISLSLTSTTTLPDTVNVHYMISKKSASEETAAHNHGSSPESTAEFTTIHENIVLKDGKAIVSFTPTVAGEFVLTVEIEKLTNGEASFSIEVPFSVGEKQSSGMMGMSSTYWYLGAIAMAGMMVVMFTVRGGIF